MNERNPRRHLVLGIIIIAIGVLSLLDNLIRDDFMTWVWIIVLAASSVISGWHYIRSRETWAGVVAYVTGAVAAIILFTAEIRIQGTLVPVLVMAIIGLPFLVVGLRDPNNRGLLIPAYVMFAIALLIIITDSSKQQPDELIPAYVMAVIGLPFIVMAFVRHNYGLLIPGGIMLALSLFFVGSFVGVNPQVFTIIVPLLLIAAGGFLMLKSVTERDKSKRENP